MPKFHCLSCRREVEPATDTPVLQVRSRNGKVMVKITCGGCGKQVTSFANRADIEVYESVADDAAVQGQHSLSKANSARSARASARSARSEPADESSGEKN